MKLFIKILVVFVLIGGILTGLIFLNINGLWPFSKAAGYPVSAGGMEFQSAPKSVCSLSPGMSKELYAIINEDAHITAVSDYCTIPQGQEAERIGSPQNPNIEKILSLKPDVVFSKTQIRQIDKQALQDAGIAFAEFLPCSTLDEYLQQLKSLYQIFYGQSAGEEKYNSTAAEIQLQLDNIKQQGQTEQKSALFLINLDGAIATPDTFSGNIIEQAGLTNAATQGSNYTLSTDVLTTLQPDYIILPHEVTAEQLAESMYKDLEAIQKNKIIYIDFSPIELQCKDVLNTVLQIHKAVYGALNTSASS